MNRLKNRAQNEDGAVLLLALGFLTFIGVVAVVLLNYTTTSLRATINVRDVRNREYAADGVAEAAITKFRDVTNAASANSNNCLASTTINSLALRADCQEAAGTVGTATDVTFTVCPASSAQPCPASAVRLVARVKYTRSGSSVLASVSSWSVRR